MNLSKLANKIYFNQNPEGLWLIKYKEAHPGFEFDYEDKFKSNEEDGFVYILKGMKFDYKNIPIFLFHKCKFNVTYNEMWFSISHIYLNFYKIWTFIKFELFCTFFDFYKNTFPHPFG